MLRDWLREDGAYWTVDEVRSVNRPFFTSPGAFVASDKGLTLVIMTTGTASVNLNEGEIRLGGSRMLLHVKSRGIEFINASPDAAALVADIIPSREAPIGDSLYDMYDKYPQYRRYCQSSNDVLVFDDSFGLVYSTVQALAGLDSDRWIFSRMYAYYIVLVITCFSDESSRLRASGNRHVRKAVKYIIESCSMPITPRDVASCARVNPSHLRRLFLQETGLTPGEYIARLRMERVNFLLIHTDFSLAEIARMTGFSSSQYLSGAYKKRFAMSPSEFRAGYNVTCGYDTLEGYDTMNIPGGLL